MGAPKQKWTSEEEDALKAGVVKHGAGKWRTILKDPEFSGVLCLRSNVDLKDKWRNMSVLANGWGTRDRVKVAPKRSAPVTRRESHLAHGLVSEDFDGEIVDAKPLATDDDSLRIGGPSRSGPRMESLILEAIRTLKKPYGSDKAAIAMFIEEQYWSPPNFKEILSTTLKLMTAAGKLIKAKGAYTIPPSSGFLGSRKMAGDVKRKEPFRAEKTDAGSFKKMQIDSGSTRTRIMNAQEAAAAAARAVAEAEMALAEAEAAAREAEAAEAEAAEAQAFAEAAMRTLKNRNSGNMGIRT